MSLATRIHGRCEEQHKSAGRCELPQGHNGYHKAAGRVWRVEAPFVPAWRANLQVRDETGWVR